MTSEIFDRLITQFESMADAERAVQMERYMKGIAPFYGIPSAPRRQATLDIIKEYPKLSKAVVLELASLLWQQPMRECQYAGMDILDRYKKLLSFEDLSFILELIRSKSWWDTVDLLAIHQVGQLVKGQINWSEILIPWTEDPDMWIRRTAILCQLKYKKETDATLLEETLVRTMDDHQFFIQKAIGWSLREYSKTNPNFVRNFLEGHGHQLGPVALREAKKYI